MNKINTQQYEGIFSKVYVDDRENKRIDYAMEQYAPFNPIREHLDIGDYIFVGENGVKVVFEYKTGSDFINSITENNHLHNQTYDMITNFEYTFIIVETKDLKKELDSLYYATGKDVSLSQINGAISEYSCVSTVLFTQTKYQAFDLMMRVAGKIIQNKPFKYKFGKKSPNYALNLLSFIRGIDSKAEDIVNTLNLKTRKDITTLTKEDLLQVDGIGEKTAEKIIKNIGEQV